MIGELSFPTSTWLPSELQLETSWDICNLALGIKYLTAPLIKFGSLSIALNHINSSWSYAMAGAEQLILIIWLSSFGAETDIKNHFLFYDCLKK